MQTPEEERHLKRTGEDDAPSEGRNGSCTRCGKRFSFYPAYHTYKLTIDGRRRYFCSYTCYRAAQKEQEQRAREAYELGRANRSRAQAARWEERRKNPKVVTPDQMRKQLKKVYSRYGLIQSEILGKNFDQKSADEKRNIRERCRNAQKRIKELEEKLRALEEKGGKDNGSVELRLKL